MLQKLRELMPLTQKPPLFTKSTASMWNDDHISKGILDAHLNPDIDAASRKAETIAASLRWLLESTRLPAGSAILDLGCGPGLYAARLAAAGHHVTGIDFSKRSVDYARQQAALQKLFICYHYQDYLTINYDNIFDLAIMIYCDFGVLPDPERDLLLQKVSRALKPGGRFIFDIFTPCRFAAAPQEENSWFIEERGFWRAAPHLGLKSCFYYPEAATHLDQYIILDETGVEVYRNWDRAYTAAFIEPILKTAGLGDCCYFADVTGKPVFTGSETLCVTARKETGRG